jgi:hypothetical protein
VWGGGTQQIPNLILKCESVYQQPIPPYYQNDLIQSTTLWIFTLQSAKLDYIFWIKFDILFIYFYTFLQIFPIIILVCEKMGANDAANDAMNYEIGPFIRVDNLMQASYEKEYLN